MDRPHGLSAGAGRDPHPGVPVLLPVRDGTGRERPLLCAVAARPRTKTSSPNSKRSSTSPAVRCSTTATVCGDPELADAIPTLDQNAIKIGPSSAMLLSRRRSSSAAQENKEQLGSAGEVQSQIHEGEASLQGVAHLQAEPDVTPEAILIAVAHLSAEAAGEVKLGEALLQGVAHMGFDPEHTSPSGAWGQWSTDIAHRRIVPGRHRRDRRRTGAR